MTFALSVSKHLWFSVILKMYHADRQTMEQWSLHLILHMVGTKTKVWNGFQVSAHNCTQLAILYFSYINPYTAEFLKQN